MSHGHVLLAFPSVHSSLRGPQLGAPASWEEQEVGDPASVSWGDHGWDALNVGEPLARLWLEPAVGCPWSLARSWGLLTIMGHRGTNPAGVFVLGAHLSAC